jgi:multidrug efflux pump subunit AcrA (membrane-fusion protein)
VVSAKDSASSDGSVSGTSVITMADLDHPEIEFSVDETDMDKVAVGYEAEVTFDAIPDRVFTGTVSVVEPSLTTENNYQVLKGLIALNMNTDEQNQVLIKGLTASVEIIGGEAQNATLVSVDALRSLGDGSYVVFVVDQSGELTMREVEIGIMDYTYAQVISGLKEGETVSTGSMESIQ